MRVTRGPLRGRSCPVIAAGLVAVLVAAWAGPRPVVRAAQALTTVWDGVYTDAQAERGKAAYEKDCAFCHLSDLAGQGFAPPLIESAFSERWGEGTVGELYTVVKSTMPQDKPDSISAEAYADIIAFVLKANKFPAGQQELKPDPAALKTMTFKKPGK